jgi:hypothetical protein
MNSPNVDALERFKTAGVRSCVDAFDSESPDDPERADGVAKLRSAGGTAEPNKAPRALIWFDSKGW